MWLQNFLNAVQFRNLILVVVMGENEEVLPEDCGETEAFGFEDRHSGSAAVDPVDKMFDNWQSKRSSSKDQDSAISKQSQQLHFSFHVVVFDLHI